MSKVYWEIAVDAPMSTALTYSTLASEIFTPGQSVHVPLGKRKARGILLKPTSEPDGFTIKEILERDEERPTLFEPYLSWFHWLAQYYAYPLGPVMAMAFAPLKKGGRGSRKKPIVTTDLPLQGPPALTTAQSEAIKNILASAKSFSSHLLFGVTGSGKTEVYLHLLAEIIAQGKQGVVLVPEISLTPQLVERFVSRFGSTVAVIHSQLTEREKTDQWWEMFEQKKQILIGARSALFCPLPNLGLIVVDEEHEASFKQEEHFKYHARDAAVMLAKLAKIPIVLGSATPSMESWQNVLTGRYQLHELPDRVANRPMPQIEVLDLRFPNEQETKSSRLKRPKWLSEKLLNEIELNLQQHEQVALFLNRRGGAAAVLCPQCGTIKECANCDISLTLHKHSHLICHYCGFHENFPTRCNECGHSELEAIGLGTEKVETDLTELFPQARIRRADRDEIRNREDLESLIKGMEDHSIDILIGTQMIAKGLDFRHLTLVGVLLADIGLGMPDFRSAERNFQLMMQMSGRAGRHESPGRVIVQTYNPDHLSLIKTVAHDYRGFAETELNFRQMLNYPPYGKLISLRVEGTDLNKVVLQSENLKTRLKRLSKHQKLSDLEILGPAPAALARLRGNYRYQILIKTRELTSHLALVKWLPSMVSELAQSPRIKIEVDPINLV